ncbi:MAG TPA: hypothetical protein PLM52_14640 [Tabrizicola sp.]|jgi:hypothetical protein|nr:hypothetical protein [Tabrizicola sp.]
MTNVIAFWLAVLILGAGAADLVLNDGLALSFVLRKFLDLIEWVAFWR